LNPKNREFVKRIRQELKLSEVDASDKDILDCFGNTNRAYRIFSDIADEKLKQVLGNKYYS
jgi:hypothetical protein